MKKLFQWLAVGFVLLASGCAQLGLEAPQTFNEKLAVGYSTVAAVRTAALTLLQSGKLTPDDAQNVQNQADNAKTALDVARTAYRAGDTGAAGTKLDSTITILTALQTYLTSKGAK